MTAQHWMMCAGFVWAMSSVASADDWPQWMGPNRDNVWRENGIVEKFPDGGPKILWRTPVSGGYAGPAVAAGKVFVTDIDQTNTAFGRDVVRSMPAFANKHAYIRNDKEIICVDLAK